MEPKSFYEAVVENIREMREDIGNIIGNVFPSVGETIRGEELPAIKNNPYKDIPAYVRQGNELCDGEKDYLKKRLPIVKVALEKLLNLNQPLQNEDVPTIAIVSSGGGYRALLCTLGFLRGIEKIKLLDTTTYAITLSGSTGAVAPLISMQMPLKMYKEYMLECVGKSFFDTTDEEEDLIFETGAVKAFFNQPKTPVDIYGDLLGNRFFEILGTERHRVYLSDQAKIIQNGKYPYPIYTCIDGNENIVENQNWYEFGPHEIGNATDGTYIPTWTHGRVFYNGESVKGTFEMYPPEKNIPYLLGTFWSAFGANNYDIKEGISEFSAQIGNYIKTIAPSYDGERPLDFVSKVPNYMHGMTTNNPESAKDAIRAYVDAGTDFNLPIPPIDGVRRKADVIIICDASADKIGEQLHKTAAYMKRNNRPFPTLDFKDIDKKTISIFKENDPSVPVVIYMPRISDQQLLQKHLADPQFARYKHLAGFDLEDATKNGCAQTIHFQYNKADAKRVIDQMEFNVRVNQAAIINALNFAVERKKKQTKQVMC
jgi:hypothetical protein